MKKLLVVAALLLACAQAFGQGQISGAGNIGCSGTTATGIAATSATSNNTVLTAAVNVAAYGVQVQLDQTSTISGGVITFQTSSDGGTNYITAPVVLNGATGAALTNPYTLVASTNQSFLVPLAGAANFQVKLTTAITGSATVTPYITLICTAPTTGPLVPDASGNLKVNIAAQSLGKVLVTPDPVALPAGSALIGKVGIDQTTPGTTNKVSIGTDGTVALNAAVPAGTNLVGKVGIDQTTPGTTNKVSIGTDGTVALNAALPAGTNLIGESPNTATATTTNAAATCYLTSAGTTNSTNCKGSAGNVYGIYVINTTTTNYFLRMYNASSAPTCSSATGFIETIPALGAAANGGGISRPQIPQAYSTGIGFCLTGGGSSTDNTNAATGVYVTILYK